MTRLIDTLMDTLEVQPILMDVGSAGGPPDLWRSIAAHSTYVGFDPSLQEAVDTASGRFRRTVTVDAALIADPKLSEVRFFVAANPQCSSTLRQSADSLSDYLFAPLFEATEEVTVRATSAAAVLEKLNLPAIDWFKTDSQGTDLRLFLSIPDSVRSKVLAVDLEPGLIDAYTGEDLFTGTHEAMQAQGFWSSMMHVRGAVRFRHETLRRFPDLRRMRRGRLFPTAMRPSPAWCEVRYLRTVESLRERGADMRDVFLLWTFALLDGQYGFALDLLTAFRDVWDDASLGQLLEQQTVHLIKRSSTPLGRWLHILRDLPRVLRQAVRDAMPT